MALHPLALVGGRQPVRLAWFGPQGLDNETPFGQNRADSFHIGMIREQNHANDTINPFTFAAAAGRLRRSGRSR
ncbi:protein of unknown function [Candidatus Promineifilum breve]|uniref:Uncharacterized protein n=1 Tax=Candidatus Promineifilum breve TaxID=1806508 RepID=A0A170PG99_9CHLR|nr:protein of unknown function [Candidatus Promineifilum breve]